MPREDAGYSALKPDFTGWQAKTTFVEPTPAAQSRYEQHKADIEGKKAGDLEK